MIDQNYDYGEFQEKASVGDNLLTQIRHMALDQQRAEADVARLEEELAAAKVRLRTIREKTLPELMENAGLKNTTTKDDIEVDVKDEVYAHISKANQPEAHRWVDENEHGNLIKRSYIIDFNKDEEKLAYKFAADLAKRKNPLRVKRKDSIHPQTLVKFVKEMLEQGVDLPQDLFGVHKRKVTNVKVK